MTRPSDSGAPERISNLRFYLRRVALYPLSYRGRPTTQIEELRRLARLHRDGLVSCNQTGTNRDRVQGARRSRLFDDGGNRVLRQQGQRPAVGRCPCGQGRHAGSYPWPEKALSASVHCGLARKSARGASVQPLPPPGVSPQPAVYVGLGSRASSIAPSRRGRCLLDACGLLPPFRRLARTCRGIRVGAVPLACPLQGHERVESGTRRTPPVRSRIGVAAGRRAVERHGGLA